MVEQCHKIIAWILTPKFRLYGDVMILNTYCCHILFWYWWKLCETNICGTMYISTL